MSQFHPNPEQQAIFNEIKNGRGHLFVSAGAGSGKTTTLVEASKLLTNRKSALFLAFNKTIVEELKSRLPSDMECKTLHSAGYSVVKRAAGNPVHKDWMDGLKYKKVVRIYLATRGIDRDTDGYAELVDNLDELVRFLRLSLADWTDPGEVEAVIRRYELRLPNTEFAAACARTVLEWGTGEGIPAELAADRQRTLGDPCRYGIKEHIDYTDMIYLPVYLNLKPWQYQTIFVDEAQDLSPCQLSLVLKMLQTGGRMVFVGDPKQAIYAFAGAASDSVERIIQQTGAKVLPLMCCYRCPESHIQIANEIVPDLRARDGAPWGAVSNLQWDHLSQVVTGGDMILCRTTAPLIRTTFALIQAGIPATVRGRDIAEGLAKVVEAVTKIAGYTWSRLLDCLDTYERNEIARLSRKEGMEMQIQSVSDRCESVRIFHERRTADGTVYDATSLSNAIRGFFEDETRGKVICSTIHKAKGLEANRIFLLASWLMPHPMARQPEAAQQEEHLRYIAYTRAKAHLTFLIGDGTERNAGLGGIMGVNFEWLASRPVGYQPAQKTTEAPAVATQAPLFGTEELPAPVTSSRAPRTHTTRTKANGDGQLPLFPATSEITPPVPLPAERERLVALAAWAEQQGILQAGASRKIQADAPSATDQQIHFRLTALQDIIQQATAAANAA